jgi:predicted transcriptional regulator
MPRPVTVRLDESRLAELDALATAFDRDRSYLINAAIEAYLEVQRWHLEAIEEGLRDAEAGRLASDDEVEKAWAAFTG